MLDRFRHIDWGDRGIMAQAASFALYGSSVTALHAVYSESPALWFRVFEIATTQFGWSFAPLVAYLTDRGYDLFRTKAEIRAGVHEKGVKEGLAQGLEAGREQGIEAGRKEGKAMLLAELIERAGGREASVHDFLREVIDELDEDDDA